MTGATGPAAPHTESSPLDLEAGLARLGYESFRPGQREAIETLLDAGKLLLVAPTGGGKSLIYQLPGALLPGTTIVISPLIALMQDQVQALEARGVSATFLASTLGGSEMRQRMGRLAGGGYKLAYVAPERLVFPGFRGLLQELQVPLLAVDEAHCISEWGHDFRPEYMQIGELIADLAPPRVLACTATATPIVRDEILARMGLGADTPQLLQGFARPNLALRALEVRTAAERDAQVDALLAEALEGPGAGRGGAIVYCPTRRLTEEESARLQGRGWRAAAYHAGMNGPTREQVQHAFMDGSLEVATATNAFGMGIDRADVRAVVHLAPPGSVEAYYQEVGRAGRDGADAWGLMLTSPGDMPLRRRLLERGGGDQPPAPEVVAHKWNLFLELMRWAEGGTCRHDAILRYFGDEVEVLQGCGRCDVCRALKEAEAEGEGGDGGATGDAEQVALVVRKALSGVARVHQRFGLTAAVKLLAGASDPRLERAGLPGVSTYGVLKEYPQEWLLKLLRRCVTAGWVDFTPGDRPLAILTEEGREVMKAQRPARLVLPPVAGAARSGPVPARTGRGSKPTQRAVPDSPLASGDTALFEALRAHRMALARAAGVPPYVVASDRTLREIAALRPTDVDQLLQVHGIGQAKATRYGRGLLAVVAREGEGGQ